MNRIKKTLAARTKIKLIIFFVLLAHLWSSGASALRLPVKIGPAAVNINLPQEVGQILGSIFTPNQKRNVPARLQHSFGPLSLNVNFQPQSQSYQYTPENYQFQPPPVPIHQSGGGGYYYPQGQPSYQYIPQTGYYGAGYYPATPQIREQQSPQNQPQQYWPAYPDPTTTIENPYMRPSYPSGPIMPMNINSYRPPLVPIKEVPTKPSPHRSIKKGIIIMPNSPLYIHIPEEPTEICIDPR